MGQRELPGKPCQDVQPQRGHGINPNEAEQIEDFRSAYKGNNNEQKDKADPYP